MWGRQFVSLENAKEWDRFVKTTDGNGFEALCALTEVHGQESTDDQVRRSLWGWSEMENERQSRSKHTYGTGTGTGTGTDRRRAGCDRSTDRTRRPAAPYTSSPPIKGIEAVPGPYRAAPKGDQGTYQGCLRARYIENPEVVRSTEKLLLDSIRSRDRVLEPSKVYFETVQSPPGVPEAFRNASNTFEGRRGV